MLQQIRGIVALYPEVPLEKALGTRRPPADIHHVHHILVHRQGEHNSATCAAVENERRARYHATQAAHVSAPGRVCRCIQRCRLQVLDPAVWAKAGQVTPACVL